MKKQTRGSAAYRGVRFAAGGIYDNSKEIYGIRLGEDLCMRTSAFSEFFQAIVSFLREEKPHLRHFVPLLY
ncbi:MAG: hypothetical protein IJD43_03735 [Thermoguttaceae bacterium]|nr:hypothetical protein [Thermoguttaceae bacterium]